MSNLRNRAVFWFTAGMFSLSLVLGCGDDDNGPIGPGDPAKIVAINGVYYKGEMGDTIPDTILKFAVADKNDNYLPDQQILLNPLAGDGELSHLSITTDSTGVAGFTYAFTGSRGHARIRLMVYNIDTVDILLRANTLIPGPSGQGQYVLFNDTYADVKNFNGTPASVDMYSNHSIIYVNYEASLGVVVMVYDLDTNAIIYDTSSVYGVIVNTVYEGTTNDAIPIGIGSSISDIRSVFGEPDTVRYDSASSGSPGDSAVYVRDLDKGLTFYCDFEDTTVFEIHLIEWVPSPATGDISSSDWPLSDSQIKPRRFRLSK